MLEHCPIPRNGMSREITECSLECQERMDEATAKNHFDGEYDSYSSANESDCSHLEVQFSCDAIHALGKHLRSYVIVDECVNCGDELGERGYKFFCPLGTE